VVVTTGTDTLEELAVLLAGLGAGLAGRALRGVVETG
jgi:L-asparaginase/Glu-tRNA(Gln) amidotransferase subunit D